MNKFAWLKAAQMDNGLTDKDFRLAVLIGVSYTRGDGVGWSVELDDLAASIPGGLSRRRLIDALTRLVNRGYLVETGRSGGGRAQRARRSFNLCKPMTPASGVVTETPDASGTGFKTETHDASVQNPRRQRPKPLTAASQRTDADEREDPLTGTSTGTSTGDHAHAREDEPPPRYCPNHPNGSPGGSACVPCMRARQKLEDWTREGDERERAARAAWRRARESCQRCGGTGHIDVDENTVARCPDCSTWRKQARS